MLVTLNTINRDIQEFVNLHKMIVTYRFEDVGDNSNIKYPFLHAELQPSPVSMGKKKYVIRFYLSDRVNHGNVSKVDVLSDTHQTALDLLSYFNLKGNDYKIDTEVTLNDFIDGGQDEVCGWWFDVTFWAGFSWNKCSIPI